MASRARVVVTGMGALSGLGQGVAAHWDGVSVGRDANRPFQRKMSEGWAADVAGHAAWMDPPDTAAFAERFNPQLLGQMEPTGVYAVLAALEAVTDAGLVDDPDRLARAGVLFGCGGGGLVTLEQSYLRVIDKQSRSLHPLTIARQMPSSAASQVSMVFGARGPCFGLTSACASSSHAIAEGAEMIASGRLDVAIVGGAEAPLTSGCWLAWQGLRVMARERCRPFSADRDGLVLGEGAACLVLESEAHAQARGAAPLFEVLGSGASADAHHITQPDGKGAAAAIAQAMAAGGVDAATPMLISSHGTGTQANDATESKALIEVLGGGLEACRVIATKSSHGHLLGAGAALEFILGLKALEARLAPPILNFTRFDPDCRVPLVLGAPAAIDHDILLSNAFAFGGLNSVLLARKL